MTHATGPTSDMPPPGGGNDRDARGESPLGTPAGTTGRDTGTRAENALGAGTGAATAPGAAHANAAATGGTGAAGTGTHAGTGNRLLPQDECDQLALRMQQAVARFVDGPRGAVEEADHVLEDIAAHFAEAMTNRRRGLRASWQADRTANGPDTAGDTEQFRLALRDYRELAERLLRV
jgi:hypothetical protein